jgi:O-methyltransferase
MLAIYNKYESFTMIHQNDYIANLLLVDSVRHIEGVVVECGVWRGGMIAGMADVLGPNREYVLCDSFEGLPTAKEIDGPAAQAWQQNTGSPNYHDNCAAPIEVAQKAISLSRATRVRYAKGWFEDTLRTLIFNEPIAILRLDGDWYDSTMTCLTVFKEKIAKGGIIVIDDYYAWDGCSRAVHDFLSSGKLSWRLYQWSNRVCYIRMK